MSFEIPDSADEVVQRSKIDVQRELPGSNPFLPNSWMGGLVTAFANRVFEFYFALTVALREAIPDTAIRLLERWANIWNVSRTAATTSSGILGVTGTGTVPLGATLATSDGDEYTVQTTVVIGSTALAVTSILRAGSVATVTTTANHLYSSLGTPTISGAVETEYNVTDAEIVVTGDDTFTYTVTGSPSSPATGTIISTDTAGSVTVNSVAFGDDQNLAADTELVFQSPIGGIDNTAGVTFGGIGGGADQETTEALRVRYLERLQNPIAHFSVSEITAVSKTVAGVTRVFVEEITPVVGQVTIYFMRDNQTPSIPSGAEVQDVQDALEPIRPANTRLTDVIVAAPSAISTAFTFSALTPNTTSMQAAINDSLDEFYADRVTVGVDIDEDAYRSAIYNTVDTTNNAQVTTFELSAPSGDITIASGEIGTKGNVVFP